MAPNRLLDVSKERYMPLDVQRLLSSDTWQLLPPSPAKAVMQLWSHAWQEVPAGTLPADESRLAEIADAGENWPSWRSLVMRGFEMGDDGRWHHPKIATLAQMVKSNREKSKNGNRNEAPRPKSGSEAYLFALARMGSRDDGEPA